MEPMPFHARRAYTAAFVAMSSTASRMHPDEGPLRHRDPVAYADLVTTMNDQRAALCLAAGRSPEDLDRNGFQVAGQWARAHVEARRAKLEARRFPVGFGCDARDARAACHAATVMVDAADAMSWAAQVSRDAVALADARTALDDARAAFALAASASAAELDRSGVRRT